MTSIVIPFLIFIIVIALVVVILVAKGGASKGKSSSNKSGKSVSSKGKSSLIKEYEKKLTHDPHNVSALEGLGEIYFEEKNWEKVWGVYKTLYEIAVAHVEIDVAKATLRMGVAAYSLEKYDDSIRVLMISAKKNPDSFDANMYLGKAFYKKNIFDKATICFKKAKLVSPENLEATEYLALGLFKLQKYRECLPYLKRVLDEHPENKELLFDMAVAMAEAGMADKALKIFVHLRPDPQFGALSCLESGKMHEKQKNFTAAIADYEIAFKLQNVPEQIKLQLMYRCANDYISSNNIQKGLGILKQIQSIHANYKDVDSLVSRYQELNQNQNLQVYLLSGTSDFVALCRKFITAYYKDAFVKVEDVSVASESIEVICSVESNKWEAKELFRFYRTQTVIGDIYVREFHTKMRDTKCDNGFCVTMGSFSESAHKYTEGRPIDLIEKDELCKILKKINLMK